MENEALKKELHPFVKIFILFGVILVSLSLCILFVQYTLWPLFGIEYPKDFFASTDKQIANVPASLYMQSIASTFGTFILPALLFLIFLRKNVSRSLKLDFAPPAKYFALAFIITISGSFFISLLVDINTAIPLPTSLSFLRSTQNTVDKLLEAFFAEKTMTRFLVLTLVVAILPALGEELLFRGVLQNLLSETNLKQIGAAIVTGFAFSAMHLEFNNFLAIWCMGAVLGLLYYYTQSLWVTIFAHFVNNFLMVAAKFAFSLGWLGTDITDNSSFNLLITIPAGVIMIAGLYQMRQWSKNLQLQKTFS
jgi:hypothetical protein